MSYAPERAREWAALHKPTPDRWTELMAALAERLRETGRFVLVCEADHEARGRRLRKGLMNALCEPVTVEPVAGGLLCIRDWATRPKERTA